MKIFIEKEFETRSDLDNYIKTTFGDNAEVNKGVTLETDADTLQKLKLDESTSVHGVKVVEAKEEVKADKSV